MHHGNVGLALMLRRPRQVARRLSSGSCSGSRESDFRWCIGAGSVPAGLFGRRGTSAASAMLYFSLSSARISSLWSTSACCCFTFIVTTSSGVTRHEHASAISPLTCAQRVQVRNAP